MKKGPRSTRRSRIDERKNGGGVRYRRNGRIGGGMAQRVRRGGFGARFVVSLFPRDCVNRLAVYGKD